MDAAIQHALDTDQVIDITTTGRHSDQPKRIEIWFHRVDGQFYITGLPGKRGWFANLTANPDFTFHLKKSAQADLPARATVISDPTERRAIFEPIVTSLDRTPELDKWIAASPLVRVDFKSNSD